MTFASIPAAAAVFVDANTFIYHFTNDPKYGVACTQLLKRVELQQVRGFTSAHVMADVAHRLMTLEAISLKGWPVAGIAARLRKHHAEIAGLNIYRQALARIPVGGVARRKLEGSHAKGAIHSPFPLDSKCG